MVTETDSRKGEHSSAVWVGDGLFTDLYELSMLQAYHAEGMNQEAVFSLSVRQLPPQRNYLIACGLDTVLEHLQRLRFGDADIAYLRSLGHFSESFLDWLHHFRFRGRVRAVPEGTPVFAHEPILEIEAPLPDAQLVETLVMNQIQLQTVLATKAERVVRAAQGRRVLDFAARRMHGIDAAVQGARAFYVGGVDATSNLRAGQRYGIPVAGTMAHSYVQAHASERAAFEAFLATYPETVLLVDTYDTHAAVDCIIDLAHTMGTDFRVRALRLDSGDLVAESQRVRHRLDAAGLNSVQLMASGGLDEHEIARLLGAGAALDGFGVGTSMGVSEDAPHLDIVYKLCAYAGVGRMKLSTGKTVLPGPKQIFRSDSGGRDTHDTIARAHESLPGRPLLATVMDDGRRLGEAPTLDTVRTHTQAALARLPSALRGLSPPEAPYPVHVSAALAAYRRDIAGNIA
ncbi:nicotinate phosphoribosyltransferase [Algiphilus sp.]|uniref:nicotinate phosphoribosyltransferase n=1 Tax=Algiphilus sp. TaxID=1872431 RepID=UPI003B525E1E